MIPFVNGHLFDLPHGLPLIGGQPIYLFGLLVAIGVDILTLGQYLRPSPKHLAVARFATPDEFAALKQEALAMGFPHVESGPMVRSSYHADGQRDIVLALRNRA
jgi:lipoate synthase